MTHYNTISLWLVACTLAITLPVDVLAQSSKISGVVRSGSTGEPLVGVNVIVEGLPQGAVTDLEGHYFLLRLQPGEYALRFSYVGFTSQIVQNIEVNTGRTTTIDVELQNETIGIEGFSITASRPIIDPDVSANVATLNSTDYENIPLTSIDEALELQAGIEPNLLIRGSESDQAAFLLDGMSLRTGRQTPLTHISLTAIEQAQVQTGGFSAEYSNVRSGLINVTTKEPSLNRYAFDGFFSLDPPQPNSFDGRPDDPDSFLLRPFLDPEIAFEGTSSLNPYEELQYASFEGWNNIALDLQAEGFDVSPEELLAFAPYGSRKSLEINQPDYVTDVTLSGPLGTGPLANQLGNPRLSLSYRGSRTMYPIPQARSGHTTNTLQFKGVTNLNPDVKLGLSGLFSTERGIQPNGFGVVSEVWNGETPRYPWQIGNNPIEAQGYDTVFGNALYNRTQFDHRMLGASLSHAFKPNSFYEIKVHSLVTNYNASLPPLRDDSFFAEDGNFVSQVWAEQGIPESNNAACIGGLSDLTGDGSSVPYCVGGAPLGFSNQAPGRLPWETSASAATVRDTSRLSITTARFDLTSQINRYVQLKTGAEIIYSEYKARFGGVFLLGLGQDDGLRTVPQDEALIQGNAYVQAKLELGGMIANPGVRIDYIDPLVDWWVINNPFSTTFNGDINQFNEVFDKQKAPAQLFVSPRLGVSFPISQRSKIYFNYGHFRQQLSGFFMFGFIQSRSAGVEFLGDPTLPMPLTVSYEIGIDQSLFDQFLIRVSGFYRDIRNEPSDAFYTGLGDFVQYTTYEPWNYADNRGAEITITKHRGKWLEGFINYTFLQTKSGRFGFREFYENSFRQQEYLRTSGDFRQQVNPATPFARMSLTFKTPQYLHPLTRDWRINLTGEWREGLDYYWNGLNFTPNLNDLVIPGFKPNVSWKDYWMADMRISKKFNTPHGDLQFFLDIRNVFNIRQLYPFAGYAGRNDDQSRYLQSLHYPADVFQAFDEGAEPYVHIPGSDQPGDFRKPGVAYQPIEAVRSIRAAVPNPWAWFWSQETETYHRWTAEGWELVPGDLVDQVLEDKAYIDMPNNTENTFLNPRRFSLGLRFSF